MRRLALIAVAGIVVAGCGSSHASSPAPARHSRYPVVVHSPRVAPLRATTLRVRELGGLAQLLSRKRLRIVTTGSSSCPSVPDELVVLTSHRIRIHLTVGSWEGGRPAAQPPTGGVCTADLGTTSMLVTIDPKLIDVHRPLTVLFSYNESKKRLVRIAAPLND
jgi:hypothetical protein